MTPACRVWHADGASEDRAAPLQRYRLDQEPGRRSPVRRLAWWIDRPSASAPGPNGVRPLASSLVPWTGGGSEGSDPVRKRVLPRRTSEASEPGRGEVEPPIPRFRHGGKVYPSAGRPSETTEQGVLRAPRDQVRGHRARAWTPCSSIVKRMANSEWRIGAFAMYVRRGRHPYSLLPTPYSLFAIRSATAGHRKGWTPARDRVQLRPTSPEWSKPWPTRPSSPRPRAASA
jgi:hypothetical protein